MAFVLPAPNLDAIELHIPSGHGPIVVAGDPPGMALVVLSPNTLAAEISDVRARHSLLSDSGKTGGALITQTVGDQIWQVYRNSIEREQASTSALAAVEQAAVFADRESLPDSGTILVSSDGTVTLQWQRPNRGAALIFAGDGSVLPVVSTPERTYLDAMQEVAVVEKLPQEFLDVLNTVAPRAVDNRVR